MNLKKNLILLLTLFALSLFSGCKQAGLPDASVPGTSDAALVKMWGEFMVQLGQQNITMEQVDSLITKQKAVQGNANLLIQKYNELYDLQKQLKAGGISSQETYTALLEKLLNEMEKQSLELKANFASYEEMLKRTRIAQIIDNHYAELMKEFPSESHPTATAIYQYFASQKGVEKAKVESLLKREDFQKVYTQNFMDGLAIRASVINGTVKLVAAFKNQLLSTKEEDFTAKKISLLEELPSLADENIAYVFIKKAVKDILSKSESFLTEAASKAQCLESKSMEECGVDYSQKTFSGILSPVLIQSARNLIAPSLVIPEMDLSDSSSAMTRRKTRGVDWRDERTQTLFTPNLPFYNEQILNDYQYVGGGDLNHSSLQNAQGVPNEYPLVYKDRSVKGFLKYVADGEKWYFEIDGDKLRMADANNIPEAARQAVLDSGKPMWAQAIISLTINKEKLNYETGDGYSLILKEVNPLEEATVDVVISKEEDAIYNRVALTASPSLIRHINTDAKVEGVSFFLEAGNKLLCTDLTAPYRCVVDKAGLAEGKLNIIARATSTEANGSATISITVNNKAPEVVEAYPKGENITFDTRLMIRFSEPMDMTTFNSSSFIVKDQLGNTVAGTFSINADKTIVHFIPTALLASGQNYIIEVNGGVKDLGGGSLKYNYNWTLSTSGYSSIFHSEDKPSDKALFNYSTFAD